MPSCDGPRTRHRTPARHRRPSRFRVSPDCSTPLRLAAHVESRSRTRKSHRFGWESFARATPETGPAPGVPTTVRPRRASRRVVASLGRAARRSGACLPPSRGHHNGSPIGSEPRRASRTCHRSTPFRLRRWPRAFHGFPSRCSVSSRRGVSSATDCSGYRSPLLACQLGHHMRIAPRFLPRPPQAPSRVDPWGRLGR